jgi:hypothetical protein
VKHAYATVLLREADESGLGFYLSELNNGASKADILDALSNSPEGRSRNVRLAGLERNINRRRLDPRAVLRRVLGK